MFHRVWTFAFFLFSLPFSVLAQPLEPSGFTKEGLQNLKAGMVRAVETKMVSGVVLYVSRNGQAPYLQAMGEADAGKPMKPDTLFRIASMTKPITSAGILILVDDGTVRLDDPIYRYLPEFTDQQVIDPKGERTVPVNRPVTVRDLLTHTSGIPYAFAPPTSLKDQLTTAGWADGLNTIDISLAENSQRLAKVPLAHQPGTAWTYGMNTDLLGRIIEVASGKTLDQFFAERIFQPLRMTDTAFVVPESKRDRLAAIYKSGADKKAILQKNDPQTEGTIVYSLSRVYQPKYFSGGAGLVSSTSDYARFLQMLLNEGELDGVRILSVESVRAMTRNQVGELNNAYGIHGDKFGLGFGVTTKGNGVPSIGSYSWGGLYHTFFWVDPEKKLVAVVMTQLFPSSGSTLWADFQKAVYTALPQETKPLTAKPSSVEIEDPLSKNGRFVKEFWFEPGPEQGNFVTNRRFRVNDPLVALHPEFGKRSETKGNGMLQIPIDEPLANIRGAELYLELWGGHPGTINKRVTVNGRSLYKIPEIGTAHGQCTHQYPLIRLERSDLVQAHNVFQFSCDRGDSFWGHFIVDNACLSLELPNHHTRLKQAKLSDFQAKVKATPVDGKEALTLSLDLPEAFRKQIAHVEFQGFYEGFDENGDGQTLDWHGMTKGRKGYDIIGSSENGTCIWDTSFLPKQQNLAVRAMIRFQDQPNLLYISPVTKEIALPKRSAEVLRFKPTELPKPFWSRDNRKKPCEITIDIDPATMEQAELRIVVWDGGVEKVTAPFTLNGKPLAFRSLGKHDVLSLRIPFDPMILVKGKNRLELHSDTTHHGIEVLLPGPELFVRTKAKSEAPKKTDPNLLRQTAMNSGGNAERGKALFASETLKCLVCHVVHGQGGTVGPDLSQIGGKFDKTHLIESILEPSAQILEGYRTTTIHRLSGKSDTGIIQGETNQELTLIDAEGKKILIPIKDIESRQVSTVSLMPTDLATPLSPKEFADLICYLETLRTGRKPTPGEGITGAIELPKGFQVEEVAKGITGATAIDVATDGRIFVCEQTGALRVIKQGNLLTEPFVKLPVETTWERGLIGVALAPDFPESPFVYVHYVAAKPYPHHVLARFTAKGDVAESGSEKILLEGDDQTKLGGNVPAGHQGGAIRFGQDGLLYIAIGDQTAEKPAQSLSTFQGKILRIHPDGSIPKDNPFVNQTTGKYQAIWALGCRNPFKMVVQPKTGRIFLNDVGGKAEEINEGIAGANYGWPIVDHGPTTDSRFHGPIHHYPTASITGGAFLPEDSSWPVEYRGHYLFTDFNHGWIKYLDLKQPSQSKLFASGFRRPVDLCYAKDGNLYVLLRDAWVIDKSFRPDTGSLLKVRYNGSK